MANLDTWLLSHLIAALESFLSLTQAQLRALG